MAEKYVKIGNKSLHYILDDNELLICLVCKVNIKANLGFDHDVLLSDHLNSKKHQKNVRALFKLCVPNWSGGHAEIIQSLVFDVSLERNESSFVSKTGNNFVCLVCQETVAQGTDSNEIITSIIRHIETDFHLNNFKDGVSWIHPVDHEVAFIMFHKSKVHCSICRQNLENIITCPVTRAMDHLNVYHSGVYKIMYQQQNKDSVTNAKSVCQSLDCLMLTDEALPSATSSSSYRDTELSPGAKSSSSDRDTELSPGAKSSSSDRDTELSPSAKSSLTILKKTNLTSDEMADQFVKVGNKSLNYIFYDNEVLICLVCKININENLSFDHGFLLSNHLNSKTHQKNFRALFKLCVPNWSGCRAEIIQSLVFDVSLERNESSFVSKTGNNFVCLVCQETVAQGTDSNEIITSIIRHIETDFHLINFKDGVSWIHPVDHEVAFIMFHKSEVYCSICKQNVVNVITCPLARAMFHLKDYHNVVYKILYQQQNKDSVTNAKSVCQEMECLTRTDELLPSSKCCLSVRDQQQTWSGRDLFQLSLSTKSSSSDKDTEQSLSAKSSSSARDTELLPSAKSISSARDPELLPSAKSSSSARDTELLPSAKSSSSARDTELLPSAKSSSSARDTELLPSAKSSSSARDTELLPSAKSSSSARDTELLPSAKSSSSARDTELLPSAKSSSSARDTELLPSAKSSSSARDAELLPSAKSSSSARDTELLPRAKSISSDKDTELSPSVKSSSSDGNAEVSFDTFEFDADEFEDLVGSDDSEESSNVSDDICVDDLICPECGEFIEIYNENTDFSMDLHLQKHKPLMSANAESDFYYQDDADYVCPICQETIQIFNGNLELSIDRHFEEERHEHERFMLPDCGDKNRFDFLSRVFDQLPHDKRDQKSVFVMDGNEVFCKVCSCTVSSSKHVPDACKVFNDHMLSTFHVDQLKASSQCLTMAVLNYNKQSSPPEDAKEQNNVFKNLCKQHPIIERNKEFIEKPKNNYYCTVCHKHICHSPKENTQALNFMYHFNGKLHKQSLKQYEEKKNVFRKPVDYSSNSQNKVVSEKEAEVNKIILELSKQSRAVFLNQAFIKEKNGGFFCEICQVVIKFSKTGSDLKIHCASHLHNTKLSARGLIYVSQLYHEKLPKKHKGLSNLTKIPFLKPHIHFINHNGEDFCCIICSMPIPGSKSTGKNVQRHILSFGHRRKCFEITCNPDFSPAQLKSKNKTVPSPSTNANQKSVNTTTEMNASQKRAKQKLKKLVMFSPILRRHFSNIETRNGDYFCKKCKEHILSNNKGYQLKQHFLFIQH